MLFVFSHNYFYKTKFFYQQFPPFINFVTIFNFRTEIKKLELFFRKIWSWLLRKQDKATFNKAFLDKLERRLNIFGHILQNKVFDLFFAVTSIYKMFSRHSILERSFH